MYYINKIVGWAVSPLGLLFLGLGCAWGLGFVREGAKCPRLSKVLRWLKAKRGWIAGITLAFLWILGCGVTTRFLGVPLEGEEVDALAEVEKAGGGGQRIDAIVLLGGGMGFHETCGRPEMFSGADRAWLAARLWQKLKVPITVSGGAADAEKAFLRDFGVPDEMMLAFDKARNTEEEASLIAKAINGPRILLVTSAWHMPRARMLFERAGFEVVAAPADYEMHYTAEEGVRFGEFFPSAEALLRNGNALKEWVARVGYALFRRE